MLVMTASGRRFDDDDATNFLLRVSAEEGQPPGFLYELGDEAGSEWALQPIIEGERSGVLLTLSPEARAEWVRRNHVCERICRQLGLPVSILEDRQQ